jgi:outer membrane receptor for monomeric catechols
MIARRRSLIGAIGFAVCLSSGALAVDATQPRHTPSWSAGGGYQNSARKRALARDPYADPAAPYKANRLSSSRGPIINIPSQTTVITRQVMDDKNATTIGEALRGTPGITIGR